MNDAWPNLFIVGAPRCGTTSLWRYLAAHPEVFMAEVKEPNFLSGIRITLNQEVHNEAAYRRLFAPGDGYALRGEASTSYLWAPSALERIRAVSPEARIVISLRDPVERTYSGWGFLTLLGTEDRSFEHAVRAEMVKTGNRIVASSTYAEDVERYIGAFGGAVHVLFLEDLARDPRRELRRLFDFLGVESAVADTLDVRRHHAHARPRGPLGELAHNSVRLRAAMRAVAPLSVRLRAQSLLVKRSSREPIEAKVEAELIDFFAHDVDRLRAILGTEMPWPRFAGHESRASGAYEEPE